MIRTSLLVLSFLSACKAFNILVFYPAPSYSHQRGILALTERLVKDGHKLFVISPNVVPGLEKHKNYTYVDLSFSYKYYTDDKKSDDSEMVNLQRQLSKWKLPKLWPAIADVARKQLMSEAVLQFNRRVKSDKIKFDLIIIEMFYISYACILAKEFSESAPIISMSSLTTDYMAEDSLGSITHLSFQPSRSYTDRMSLWQKLDNWVSHYYIVSELRKHMGISTRRYCKDVYGPEYQSTADGCDWQSKISLSLITSNPIYFYPRALGPNVIQVGPLHIKQPEKLPQNLQKWLDDAETGVIYFSLGSNVRGKSLPENVLASFLRVFGELQSLGYRVLWKWELDGEIPGQSSNILGQKWIPQQSVLAHPKVKIFIMQGGLQSLQEAVHYGIPMVGIPWYGDQEANVNKIVDAEIGVQLLPSDLDSYEKVKSAIETVLLDEKYSMNMKRLSAISHDFTARGMNQAVFWVEHVAKHGGASHLRPSTADATLFEYFCLDIISVISLFSFLFIYLLHILLKFILSKVSKAFESKLKSS